MAGKIPRRLCRHGYGGVRRAVRCGVVAENKPARVMVMVPADIAPGAYYAEVRSRFMGNSQAGKTLKTGRFGKPLDVAAQG